MLNFVVFFSLPNLGGLKQQLINMSPVSQNWKAQQGSSHVGFSEMHWRQEPSEGFLTHMSGAELQWLAGQFSLKSPLLWPPWVSSQCGFSE